MTIAPICAARRVALSSVAGAANASPSAAAASYPNRPVRWLIGFAAGGPVDIVARIMACRCRPFPNRPPRGGPVAQWLEPAAHNELLPGLEASKCRRR